MSVERIDAAITVLETLKASSQGEHWYRSVGGVSAYGGEIGFMPVSLIWRSDGERTMSTPQVTTADADLIVTLHRTIDAQLAILRASATSIRLHFAAMTNAPGGFDLEPGPFHEQPEKAWAHIERQRSDVYALASAILGES